MKSILQIMDYAAPYRGNFIAAIEKIEREVQGKANLIYLFPKDAQNILWAQKLIEDGKVVYFMQRDFFSRKIKSKNIRRLNEIAKINNVKVVHTHFIEYNYTLFIFKILFGKKIQFVTNFHNHYTPKGKLALLKTWVIKNTNNLFIGDSNSVSEGLIKNGFSPKKVTTVLNSIDFSRLEKYEIIDIFSESKKPTILMFGYPWHRKGVDVVIKAINEINNESNNSVNLAIAQSGMFEKTKEAIVNILGNFPDWIQFLPPCEDLASYYNSSTIFISSGREEGLSYAPIEAAYCKCLVICSNIQGNPLDIPNMPIYPVEDFIQLKNHIEFCLSLTDEEKNKIKQYQRNYVLEHYNVTNWVKEIVSCYKL